MKGKEQIEVLEEIDHEYTQEIVCPFCGSEWGDSWEIEPNNEDIGLMKCDDCGKQFYATRNIDITYVTEKARYGTCRKCKTENVVIENHYSYSRNSLDVEDYCEECYQAALKLFYQGINIVDKEAQE